MAAPASAPEFDVIIGWNPLVEEIVAAECYGAKGAYTLLAMKDQGGKVFKPEHLELCTGKRVLVCGSYFSTTELIRIGKVATKIDVMAYSATDLKRMTDEECELRTVDSGDFGFGFFVVDKKRFPRAERLLRRALERKPYMGDDDDEAFYRGLMHHGFAEPCSSQQEAIVNWLRGDWDITEEKLIEVGSTVEVEHERIAFDVIKGAATIEKWEDRDNLLILKVVVSGSALIMPVADALAAEGDVGVVIRYNLAPKTTSLTFYTSNGADLSWVEMQWNGGGKPNCKGTTLQGLVPITELLERLAGNEPHTELLQME